jgi:hypothetical protein
MVVVPGIANYGHCVDLKNQTDWDEKIIIHFEFVFAFIGSCSCAT